MSSLAPPLCEHCGKHRPVMVPMQPGKDGTPWQLCNRCWADGLRPTRESVTTIEVKESYAPTNDPHVGLDPPRLKAYTYEYTTTERLTTEEASAKNDVGSFARPRSRKRS